MTGKNCLRTYIVASVVLLILVNPVVHAADMDWTLTTSIQRVMEVAPELRYANAEIDMRRGELTQADAFPNPYIELGADQKIGLEDGSGGTDLNLISISQSLPLSRLGHQKDMATLNLSAAQEKQREQHLLLEYNTARAYHELQLMQARLDLAEERLAVADTYAKRGHKANETLVRYLSKNEQLRLEILRATARQAVDSAEGQYTEALTKFRTTLALPMDSMPLVQTLRPVPSPPDFKTLQARLDDNPTLVASKQEYKAAQAGIAVARSQRFADPVLSIYHERDYINGSVQDYNGVLLSVQVPLWNGNNGGVSRANAEAIKAQTQYQLLQRDYQSRLNLHEMHLGHLIKQATDYKTQLVLPTEHSLDLTRKSFDAGQVDLLTLIDAYSTHYDAHFRYLELLEQGWMEAAELRLVAGLTLQQYDEFAKQRMSSEVKVR